MNINLIVLPFEENVKSPPICMGYIAALLKKDSHNPSIIDLNFEKNIPDSDLNIVATTTVDYYNCPLLNIEEINKWLSNISKIKTPLAILGPHVTTYPDYFMKYADFLIVGEPEFTAKELVSSVNNKKDLRKVLGIYYKKNKKFIKNKPRPLIKNLDLLPFPDRDLINNSIYHNPLCKNNPYTMVISSRGCPYQCTYCYMDVYGHRWRARSAQNVINELIEVRRKYKIREILFRDDLFSLDKRRIIEICSGIIENKLNLSWHCQTRADTLNEEVIKKMAEAGCYMISLGIESGSQEILNKLNKKITLDQIKQAINHCKKYKIRTRGCFIIGSPGETKKTIQKTIDFAKELGLDYFMLSILTPYPKTPLFQRSLKKGILNENTWYEALKKTGIIETPFSFEELIKIKRNLYFKYYFRFSYILQRLTPSKIDILYHGFKPFFKQFSIKKFRGKKLN